VAEGVVGLHFDGVFGAQIGAREIFVVHVELGDGEVLIDSFIVGLHPRGLGQLAMSGGAFGTFVFERWPNVGRGFGIVTAGTAGATRTAARVVSWKSRRRSSGKWMVVSSRVFGRSGTRRVWRVGGGFAGLAGKWKLFGDRRLLCVGSRWGAGFGCSLRRLLTLICGWARSVGRSLLWARLGEGGGRECKNGQQCAGCGEDGHRI
jgi:hypothetical protein